MKHKAYICSKDCDYHIPDDWHGIDIYFSEKSIREYKKCISDKEHGCKVVEITIEIPDESQD